MTFLNKLELAITLTVGIGGGYLLNNYAENLQKERIAERRMPPFHLRVRQEPPITHHYNNLMYFRY